MGSGSPHGARVEGDGGRTYPGATGSLLRLVVSDAAAILTVREALRGGSSYVVLATVNVPRVEEASSGLLMGMVRAAYSRGQEARRLEKKLGDAMREKGKLQGLLDRHTADKRNVVHRILERAVLVDNAKKAMIATLQEPQDSDRELADSDVEGSEQAGDKVLTPRARSRGGSLSSPGGADNDRSGRGMSAGSPCRKVGKGKGRRKLALEDGNPGVAPHGSGSAETRTGQDDFDDDDIIIIGERESMGDPLVAPPGTQEVSGEDLLRVIEGGDDGGDGSRNATQGGKHPEPFGSKRNGETKGILGSMKRRRHEASERPFPQGSSFRSEASFSTGIAAYQGVFSDDDDDDDEDKNDGVTCIYSKTQSGDAGGNDAPGAGGGKGSDWKAGGSGGFALSSRRKKRVVRDTPTRVETSNCLADDRKGGGATHGWGENPGSAAFEDSSSLPTKTTQVTRDTPSGVEDGSWSMDDLE